jgi:hypothetical protein
LETHGLHQVSKCKNNIDLTKGLIGWVYDDDDDDTVM